MIDQETFENLLPLATAWAKDQEQLILGTGIALDLNQIVDARRIGVQDCSRVRVLVVDRIPLPENDELAGAARFSQVITDSSRGVAIGHGIMIRADSWGDRALLLHQLAHVAQCERSGGLEQWIQKYLNDRHSCAKFTNGSLEEEARSLVREICESDRAVLASH